MNLDAKNARVRIAYTDPDRPGCWIRIEYECVDVKTNSVGDGSFTVIYMNKPEPLPPAPSDLTLLALAALDGDDDVAAPLIDEWLAKRNAPPGFVPRARLLELLRRLEWVNGNVSADYCPECYGYQRDNHGHFKNCELAKALGKDGSDAL